MTDANGLSAGWTWATLLDITLPRTTCNPPTWGNGDFLYVDIEALDNTSQQITAPKSLPNSKAPSRARMEIRSGDVLFSLVRPYLKNLAIVPSELDRQVASTAYCVLRPGGDFHSKYLFFALLRATFIRSIKTYGESPPAARDDEFLQMEIPVAPLPEQQRIVAAIEEQFTRLDAAVAGLKRVQANLKRYRASVLKAAVEGRLTEEWRAANPPREPAPALLQRILAERRQKWEEAELARFEAAGKQPPMGWREKYKEPVAPETAGLADLPEGWCWASVDQVISALQYGTSVKADAESITGVPVIRMGNIQEGQLDLGSLKYIKPANENIAKYRLQPGDVLINRTNSPELVGKAGLFDQDGEFIFASYLIRLQATAQAMLPTYLVSCLNSEIGRRHVVKVKHQVAGQANINSQNIRSMPIPLPPLDEQQQIASAWERQLSVVSAVEAQVAADLKRADRLRQAILKRAFEGRLVLQDPSDEPASALLERIRQERAVTADGKKKQGRGGPASPLPPIAIEIDALDKGPLEQSAMGFVDSNA